MVENDIFYDQMSWQIEDTRIMFSSLATWLIKNYAEPHILILDHSVLYCSKLKVLASFVY